LQVFECLKINKFSTLNKIAVTKIARAYQGGFPGDLFGFCTPIEIEVKGLQNLESFVEQDTFKLYPG